MSAVLLMLVAALFSACATHAPTTYRQGAPMVQPAPPFNPATDSPITTGQPGHLSPRPQMEPGPKHGRVLPQTPETRREPTIWAAGDPTIEAPVVPILGELIPLPSTIDIDAGAYPAGLCMETINAVLPSDLLLAQAVAAVSRGERRCLASMLFAACVAHLPIRVARGEVTARNDWRKALAATHADAQEEMVRQCTEKTMTSKVQRLAERWLSSWGRGPARP